MIDANRKNEQKKHQNEKYLTSYVNIFIFERQTFINTIVICSREHAASSQNGQTARDAFGVQSDIPAVYSRTK